MSYQSYDEFKVNMNYVSNISPSFESSSSGKNILDDENSFSYLTYATDLEDLINVKIDDNNFGYGSIPRDDGTQQASKGINAHKSKSYVRISILYSLAVFCLIVLTTAFISNNSHFTTLFGSAYDASRLSQTKTIGISVSNSYGAIKDTTLAYPFLQGDSNQLFEPYRDTSVALSDLYDGYTYVWMLVDSDDNVVNEGEFTADSRKESFTTSINGAGKYTMLIEEYEEDDRAMSTPTTRSLEITVWGKYVRRDLSTLTNEDRDEFLDAMYTLWSTSTVDGKELYGDDYKSVYYLAVVHQDGGANPTCDEFHGDSGFMNSHVLLNHFLEQSLQLVNPKTCLHYMEYAKYFTSSYTQDFTQKHMHNMLDGGSWLNLLTADYFGKNDPYSGEIVDGRWKDAVIPTLDDQFFIDHEVPTDYTFFPIEAPQWADTRGNTDHLMSPYGLLRSPWNFNPNPKITRFNNVGQVNDSTIDLGVFDFYSGVDCTDVNDFISESKESGDIMTFMKKMEDSAHGQIHFTFGGHGGATSRAVDDILQSDYGFTNNDIVILNQYTQTLVKLSQTSCASLHNPYDSAHSSSCPIICNTTSCSFNDYFTEDNIYEFFSSHLYKGVSASEPYTHGLNIVADLSDSEQMKLAKIIINRYEIDGDMAGSGAAVDPLFWMVHGALEKLFQYSIEGGIFTQTNYDSQIQSCSGHMTNGTKSWLDGFYLVDRDIATTDITNYEWVKILNPMSDDFRDQFDFVYESFDYSSWCPSLTATVSDR